VAIKQVLQQQILASIALSYSQVATNDLCDRAKVSFDTIPVHRLSDDHDVVYRSPIALKLAPSMQSSAPEIANQLADSFAKVSQNTSSQMRLDFSVEVLFPGWIDFRLSDRSLATWLQEFLQIPPLPSDSKAQYLSVTQRKGEAGEGEKTIKNEDSEKLEITHRDQLAERSKNSHHLFSIQYAHARCCSLLRLAHRQGLIELSDLDCKTRSCQVIEPNPIPWLNDEPRMEIEQQRLRLQHPAERRLMHQILDTLDRTTSLESVSGLKLAIALSDAFEQFYSACRIWGEVKTEMPQLAQMRLGLVGVTQRVLRSLLEDQLSTTAPMEL